MFLVKLRRPMAILLAFVSLLFSVGAWSQSQHKPSSTRISDDTVLVKFLPGTNGETKRQLHSQANGSVTRSFDSIDVHVVTIPSGSVNAVINMYQKNPNVLYAEPNFIRILCGDGTDVPCEGSESGVIVNIDNNFTEQYALHNTGQSFGGSADALDYPLYTATAGADINWLEARSLITGADPVRVAVLDTGIECNHKDLACVEEKSFVARSGTSDNYGHGTHVAGIIAAGINNNIGIAGVAPSVDLGNLKVCEVQTFLGIILSVSCADADIIEAILFAADNDYKVINMSLGGTEAPQALEDAVNYAWNKGVVVVASAGNAGTTQVHYPAGYDSVIAVGATDHNDNLASYSSFGDSWVSVMAPGTAIFSSVPGAQCGQSPTEQGDCYDWKSGTSMAGPHVAGLAAVLVGEGHDNTAVRNIIENSAVATGALDQNFKAWSAHGRIDMVEALSYIPPVDPPIEPPVEPPVEPVASEFSWSIALDTVSAGKGKKNARATVTVTDNLGAPVSNVTITGNFSGDFTDKDVSGNTDGQGVAVLTTTTSQKGKRLRFDFCVAEVSGTALTIANPSDLCN